MSNKNTSNKNAHLLWLVVPVGIVLVVCFSLASVGSAASGAKDPNNSATILDRTAPTVRRQILKAATQIFEPSLEMKENVDFLLTPALLVQQAVSEDVIITYPSE